MSQMRAFFLFAALLMFPFLSGAQITQDPTTWTTTIKKVNGNQYELKLSMKLAAGWHIWSLKPGGDGLQTAPEIRVDNNSAVKPAGAVKESGKKITGPMDGVDGIVNYYENGVTYTQSLKVASNTKVTGIYMYQVCDDKMCLPPKTKKFSVEVTDAAPAAGNDTATTAQQSVAAADTMHHDTAVAAAVSKPATATEPASASIVHSGGAVIEKSNEKAPESNLWLFLTGIVNGLLSVITPCVFAMLPMTVSFFLKRSKDRKTGVKLAIQYSLSIVFIFTALGALLAVFFNKDAIHAFSTNWIVNLFFAAIFILFGISFFGAFEISLPSSWATKMDSKANTKSFSGIFFMALTLVIVSFSCTVPFISTMVTLMDKGSKVGPLIGFLGYGLGLALPFTLFAIFPAMLNELGKQGGWLNVVKVTFGFIELALAMKFLSNADIQKGWRLLDREIFLAIWIGLSFLLGAYLLGAFRFSHDSEMPKNDWGLPYLKVPRFLFATAALIFGLYLLPGMWGAPLNGMGAFVPPIGTQDFVLSEAVPGGGGAEAATSDNGAMQPVKYVDRMRLNEPPVVRKYHMTVYFDYKEALAASKALKKPVMLDFTGINCANCRKMETGVWANPEVMKRLKDDFILASLYCDANGVDLAPEDRFKAASMDGAEVTKLGEANQDIEITKYGTNSLPTYFFVDEQEQRLHENAVFYPTSAEDFIKILDDVKARYKTAHP